MHPREDAIGQRQANPGPIKEGGLTRVSGKRHRREAQFLYSLKAFENPKLPDLNSFVFTHTYATIIALLH